MSPREPDAGCLAAAPPALPCPGLAGRCWRTFLQVPSSFAPVLQTCLTRGASGGTHGSGPFPARLPISTLAPCPRPAPARALRSTNTSYQRWDEARKMWGLIVNRSRDITRQVGPVGWARRCQPAARACVPLAAVHSQPDRVLPACLCLHLMYAIGRIVTKTWHRSAACNPCLDACPAGGHRHAQHNDPRPRTLAPPAGPGLHSRPPARASGHVLPLGGGLQVWPASGCMCMCVCAHACVPLCVGSSTSMGVHARQPPRTACPSCVLGWRPPGRAGPRMPLTCVPRTRGCWRPTPNAPLPTPTPPKHTAHPPPSPTHALQPLPDVPSAAG